MFGEMLKMMRKSRNLNQVQLAAQLNVTKQTISNWENNNILSVSTDYLLELDNRFYLEVSGLTVEQIAHIQQIINDIRRH